MCPRDVLIEFYKTVQDIYPNLSQSEIKEIYSAPYQYARSVIEGDEIKEIRMRYFGTFQVYPGKAELVLHQIKKRGITNSIPQEQYDRQVSLLESYIEKLNNEQDYTKK